MKVARYVAATCLIAIVLFFVFCLALLSVLPLLSHSSLVTVDRGQALRNGGLYIGIIILCLALARLVWPRGHVSTSGTGRS